MSTYASAVRSLLFVSTLTWSSTAFAQTGAELTPPASTPAEATAEAATPPEAALAEEEVARPALPEETYRGPQGLPAPPPGYDYETGAPPPAQSGQPLRATYVVAAPGALQANTGYVAADTDEPSRAGRIAVEALGGAAGMFLGALGGFGLFCASDCDWSGAIAGVILGAGFGTPTGVYIAGAAMDGNGGLGWTMLGGAVGWLGAFALGAAAADSGSDGEGLAVLALSLPVFGSILGFELSSDASATAAERRGGFSANIATTRDGAVISASGSF